VVGPDVIEFPTLTITHLTRATERYRFECVHGHSEATMTTDTAQAMDVSVALLVTAHSRRFGCKCQPRRMFDDWPDVRMAAAQWAYDENRITPGSEYDSPKQREMHRTDTAVFSQLGCRSCEPGARMEARYGHATISLVHQPDCPRPMPVVVDIRPGAHAAT
jgi:hypothetical protein